MWWSLCGPSRSGFHLAWQCCSCCPLPLREAVDLTDVRIGGRSLSLTFHNSGSMHGAAAGVVAAYDSAGELQGEFVVQSGRILPNRQRQTDLLLPIEPHTVRFVPLPDAGSSFLASEAVL